MYKQGSQADISLQDVDMLLVAVGGSDEDNPYKKSTAFQVKFELSLC